MYGIKDPFGIRPLVLGKIGRSFVLSSETCALDMIGAKYIRDIENGEILEISKTGLNSFSPFPKSMKDHVYLKVFIFPDLTVKSKVKQYICTEKN